MTAMTNVLSKHNSKFSIQYVYHLIVALGFAFSIGCGGSGNSDPATFEGDPTWTINVFEDESTFKNFCANPRTGSDINGDAFPDKNGTTLLENHWLRAWSDNTYLWYDEIIDNNPTGFSDTEEYFDQLKTVAITSSGQPKDKFHFTFDSAEWLQLNQSGISAGYGAEFAIIESSPPRQILVAFTEPNSPASSVNLPRGAEILEIDGVDAVNGGTQQDVDVLNAGLSPSALGESHEFVIREVGATETRTITMTSVEVTTSPVQNVSTVDTETGRVGYMLFTTHIATSEEQLIDAVDQLSEAGIDDLVLDLRYNGGGLLAIASQLAYMIAGSNVPANATFDGLIFNDKHPTVNPVTGRALTPTPFYDETLGFSVNEGQDLPTLNLNRVFILSTGGTCSASEAIINGLRGIDVEVILIGSTSCGKPYGFYPTDNCGTTYFTVQFRGTNAKNFGDYSDGFSPANSTGVVGEVIPGCAVADDYSRPLGDAEEAQFKAALDYRITGTCPEPSSKQLQDLTEKSNKASLRALSPFMKSVILENRLRNEQGR
jgi:hypothetical protein